MVKLISSSNDVSDVSGVTTRSMRLDAVENKIGRRKEVLSEVQVLRGNGVLTKEHYLQVEKVGQQVNEFLIRQKNHYTLLVEYGEKAGRVVDFGSIYHSAISLFESVVEFVSRSNSVVFVIGARLFSFVFIAVVKFRSNRFKIDRNDIRIKVKPVFEGWGRVAVILVVVCLVGVGGVGIIV
jgi:hypothetical protein